jgi:hypothetical protein
MLLEWYVRFKRIDEWPEAIATALSAELVEGKDDGDGKSPDCKKIAFIYPDGSGRVQTGEMSPIDGSELFYVDKGDTFSVRYNPGKPERFFAMGAHNMANWTLGTLFAFAFLACGIIWLILRASDPRFR